MSDQVVEAAPISSLALVDEVDGWALDEIEMMAGNQTLPGLVQELVDGGVEQAAHPRPVPRGNQTLPGLVQEPVDGGVEQAAHSRPVPWILPLVLDPDPMELDHQMIQKRQFRV